MLIPKQGYLPAAMLHPLAWQALGHEAGNAVIPLTAGSNAYPLANLAIFYPFAVDLPWLVRKLWLVHGSGSAGNWDVGVYSEGGTRIVSTGSTVMGGSGTLEQVAVTETLLSAGRYYLGVARSTTGSVYRYLPAASYAKMLGIKNALTAFPLPDSVTLADPSYDFLPIFGASSAP